MAEPIWKDYFVDLGAPASSGAGVAFSIYCVPKAATIFSGTAFPRPGESTAVVRINDICADYIAHYFLEQEDAEMPAQATFRVYAGSTLKATVAFYNNWSYDPFFTPGTNLNFPIVMKFGAGQFIPWTLYSGSIGTATIYMANGLTYSCTPSKYRGNDFNNDYNGDFLHQMEYFGDSYVIPMSDYPGAVKVVYKGLTWVLACPEYVLYYANAYGGWDALPIEGRTKHTDALTRHTTGVVYDNRYTTGRGVFNFVNEVKEQYTFNTGLLNAQQSAKMHNLLNSPAVFVHSMETGIVRPLVLTGSASERKNEKGRLYSYQIEAVLAQDRLRR